MVDNNVGAAVGADVEAPGAVAGVRIVVADDESSLVHDDAAAAHSTAKTTARFHTPFSATVALTP